MMRGKQSLILAFCLLTAILGCRNSASGPIESDEARLIRQNVEYERQAEVAADMLKEQERQSEVAANMLLDQQRQIEQMEKIIQRDTEQGERKDRLLKRWEEQADRQDRILKAMEEKFGVKPE